MEAQTPTHAHGSKIVGLEPVPTLPEGGHHGTERPASGSLRARRCRPHRGTRAGWSALIASSRLAIRVGCLASSTRAYISESLAVARGDRGPPPPVGQFPAG